VAVGEVPEPVRELIRVTEEAMWAGIAAARLGGRVTDISHAVEQHLRSQAHPDGGSWGILEEFTGHGIGTAMHQPPNVPNHGRPGRGPRLQRGLVLAVEPMVTLGSPDVVVEDDEWTVVTVDGSWAAHFEHTFTLTPDGPWVLTALDGGEARLRSLGLPFGGH
jgi:methionyl aminopeptidase